MIKVYSLINKIAEKCFSEEEKAILEFQSGTRQITIAAQLKYYYQKACWEGSEEDLYDAISIRKMEKMDILKKIKLLNERINQALDPMAHDEVYLRIEGSKSSNSSISTNSDGSTSSTHASETSNTTDKSDNWNVAGARDALGEMDEVNKLTDVWDEKKLDHGPVSVRQRRAIRSAEEQSAAPKAVEQTSTKPSIVSSGDPSVPIKYRQFTENVSVGEDVSTSSSNESSNRDDTSTSTSSSLAISVNKNTGDRNIGGRKFKTGEQLVNIWKDQLPNLRNSFWRSFDGLFIHERNY